VRVACSSFVARSLAAAVVQRFSIPLAQARAQVRAAGALGRPRLETRAAGAVGRPRLETRAAAVRARPRVEPRVAAEQVRPLEAQAAAGFPQVFL